MVIRIGAVRFEHIDEGADTFYLDALEAAKKLYATGFRPQLARVSRNEGLVLLLSDRGVYSEGHHFKHAICGYDGTGPQTTVKILEMFGLRDSSLERVAAHNELVFRR